jgi:SlyX protein
VVEVDKLKEDVVDLQTQMAFQDDILRSLNEAIANHQQEILTLRRQLELLKERQEEQAPSTDEAPSGPADERPPHY